MVPEAIKNFMHEKMEISNSVLEIIKYSEAQIVDEFKSLEDILFYNQIKVLNAFQTNRISDMHFSWNTGYGYNDPGREALENVYATLFSTEAALVRPLIVNGTHALALTFSGILRPNDELIYSTGAPYETLEEVIGTRGEGQGSLKDFGIKYSQVDLKENGCIDFNKLGNAINKNTKIVALQRATGYAFRKAITIAEIREWIIFVKGINKDIICMIDNCYGEFLDILEPTDIGVDVMAGSLIKNPGGGLALSGGYIVGRKDLIEKISYRMTAPGIGGECGLTFGQTRNMLQGLFIAPKTVNGALKGAILCAKVYENLGFEVCPKSSDIRSDIIQSIKFGNKDAVIAFCEGIQAAAPIDSHVKPIPWDMPGYKDQVIMASGSFVQGSSLELSADAPMRPPFIAYFQGGLTYEHSKYGVIKSLQYLINKNLIKL